VRRLKTISIEGFKTFAKPATVSLSPGLNIVIGPNGCGKSNLIDAVAWAVGSRSSKSLRGEGMEDVLFHGGGGAAPAPRSVVRLVFSNQDRMFPIDVEDLEVSRELPRGEAGRAYINRAETRLRDVQAMLAGTGLIGGFSLVRQGMVDKLLLASPEELGGWFEESANLAGFRSRRHEAALRLEKVRTHRTEAARRLGHLKREQERISQRALRARERKQLEGELAALEKAIIRAERTELTQRLDEVAAQDGELLHREERLQIERQEAKREESALQEKLALLAGPLEGSAALEKEGALSPEVVREKAGRIHSTGVFLRDAAGKLTESGPDGWSDTLRDLDRAVGMIRGIAAAEESPEMPASPGAGIIARLRRLSVLLEELDLERSSVGHERAAGAELRARLEERRSILGAEQVESGPMPEGFEVEEARQEQERLEREIAAIGPVDETADGRETELAREIETLQGPLQDLERAEEQLTGFIREVQTHTDRIFKETFARVQERFRRNFEILFEGGEARLRLLDRVSEGAEGEGSPAAAPEAPPGVEVRIRLPRKNETAITLLSGGERTLAGLALVLALAGGGEETETGRLIILDEVDAALDESNVARFAKFLRLLSDRHQILCVTHSRLTMHQASRLIGITSGSPPCTSILVVKDLLAGEDVMEHREASGFRTIPPDASGTVLRESSSLLTG
jgi:chromosome segregation ATPase